MKIDPALCPASSTRCAGGSFLNSSIIAVPAALGVAGEKANCVNSFIFDQAAVPIPPR